MIAGRVLNPGHAAGPLLVLTGPLSFWGGFDPRTGEIIDIHHPQLGAKLGGRIVLMKSSRGSGTAPGALAESIRHGTGPAALVMVEADVTLAIGASVAAALYGTQCPVLTVSAEDFSLIAQWPSAQISVDGTIT